MNQKFDAFNNDSQSVELGELTLENQGGQVNLYGSATFTLDKQSLDLAKDLQSVVDDIVNYLEKSNATNIDKIEIKTKEDRNVTTVSNPFL